MSQQQRAAEPGFWSLPPGLFDRNAWFPRDPSSSASFSLHDRDAAAHSRRTLNGGSKAENEAISVLNRLYEHRALRYCDLQYYDWVLQVRFHSIRPLQRLTVGSWGSFLCVVLMLLMVSYTSAMFRFTFGGGVGQLALLSTNLTYFPTFNTSDNSTYHLISGTANYNPFGYAEVVTVLQTASTTPSAGGDAQTSTPPRTFQYTDGSSFDSSCAYSVYAPVTGFEAPTYANDDLAAPDGDTQLTLYAPACTALTALLGLYIALCIVQVIGGIGLISAGLCCGRVGARGDVGHYLEDLNSSGNEPEVPLSAADAQLFKYEPVVDWPPPRCAHPSVQRMSETLRARVGENQKRKRMQLIAMCVIGSVLCALALATLVLVVVVVREPGFRQAGGGGVSYGPMLALILVSCCVPLLVVPYWMALLVVEAYQDRKLTRVLAAQGHSVQWTR